MTKTVLNLFFVIVAFTASVHIVSGYRFRATQQEASPDGMVAVSNNMDDVESSNPNDFGVKPQYTEMPEPEEEASEWHVPEYVEPSDTIHAVATEGFCLKVLEDVKNKEAPYYVEGKFTGELRTDLVQQCGVQVCGFSLKYKNLVTCDKCPKDCSSPAGFFSDLLNDEDGTTQEFLTGLLEAIKSASKKGSATGAEGSVEPKNLGPDGPDGETETWSPVATGSSEGAPSVTKGFCLSVLKKVEAKEAPYYVDGSFTKEFRTDLVEQCGQRVCDWFQKYSDLITEDTSACEAKPKYMIKIMSNSKVIKELEMYAESDPEEL